MRVALTVKLYETEEQLPGRPSGELCSRSAASPTGEVLAYQDGAGVWQYAPVGPTARGHDSMAGREIVRVYVDDPANRNHERQRIARLRRGVGTRLRPRGCPRRRSPPRARFSVGLAGRAQMATHEQLWKVCRDQQAYRDGTDTSNHERPDCSSGCRYFHPLEGQAGMDWGCARAAESARGAAHVRAHGLRLLRARSEREGRRGRG